MRHINAIILLVALVAAGLPATARAQAGAPAEPAWPEAVVAAFDRIPIQDAGRVKPLYTYARFKLVQMSGKASLRFESGERLDSSRWLLDVLLRPEAARAYPVLQVENPAVMQAIGLSDAKRRTRFTLDQVAAVEPALLSLAGPASQKESADRSMFENQVLSLFQNYRELSLLLSAMDFARLEIELTPEHPLFRFFDEDPGMDQPLLVGYVEFLERMPMIFRVIRAHGGSPEAEGGLDLARIEPLFVELEQVAEPARMLTVIPPVSDPARETWEGPGDLLEAAAFAEEAPEREIELAGRLAAAVQAAGDLDALARRLGEAAEMGQRFAYEREEGGHITMELFFYRWRFFQNSLLLFVVGFVALGAMWLAPRNRWLYRGSWGLVGLATVLLVAGITLRCLIRERPPVTTLYETLLFVPAVAIVLALATEWINRRRIALSMAGALGLIGLFFANQYELKDGADTMGRMIAVLNSNFWLSTHVTTVTIGYAAGLLAAALAHVYIFGRLLGLGSPRGGFYTSLTRMTYGVVCFGVLFSTLGTVLGGIWANDSWGRFWGWDPKENGALMIILWSLVILHARLGGYIRDLGIAISSVFLGMIVVFSWWGVNLLGVGLHSYGFTSGVMGVLMGYWLIEAVVMLLGGAVWASERTRSRMARLDPDAVRSPDT